MPQMSPLNWLALFSLFIIVFLTFNVINYFTFLYTPKKSIPNPPFKKISWKW
nr:ATP synthase F0 subunit 8 [Megasoma elephas elephas]UFR82958.1 ATP synthase F0 subunit 8 [Megasoma mars]